MIKKVPTKTAVRQMLIQHKRARGAAKGALTKKLWQIAWHLCNTAGWDSKELCRGCLLMDELENRTSK